MSLMKKLHQWAQYVIADDILAHQNSLPYQQAFFLFLTLLITSAASLLSCFVFALLGKLVLVALTGCACSMGIIGLVVWYRTRRIEASVNIIVIGLMALNVVAIMLTGGLYSLLVFNVVIPLVLSLVYYGPRRMMQIFVVIALLVVVFIGVELLGKTPEPILLLTSHALVYGGITLILLYGIFGAFYIADAIRQEAYNAIQQERDSVQRRVEEATRNLEEQQENITVINYHLEERNMELQKAIQVAEAAKQLQADFLRNASHEVRTPLAAIMGFGEILADQIGNDNLAAQESLGYIHQAGQSLLDIFNSILTLSTIESSGIQLAPVRLCLREFVEQIAREFTAKAEAKKLELRCEYRGNAEDWMEADIMYLRQILHHLLSNAIKFTDQGRVHLIGEILADTANAGGEIVRWTVQDTGVGITPEFRDKLFVPFHQQDAGKTRLYGGLGLGLAITKYLVDAMHGKVWCESAIGDDASGTTFIVELPIFNR